MKRKIIKLGQATYVASLPSKWIRAHNLEKGDYLDVEEEQGDLTFRVEGRKRNKAITLDITKLDTKLAASVLETSYIVGYDPIEIIHNPEIKEYLSKSKGNKLSTTEFITTIVNEKLIGSEIIEQSDKRIIIKDLGGGLNEESTDNIFRRILFLLKDISQEIMEALTNNNLERIKHLQTKVKLSKKLILYYSRLLNQSKISSSQLKIKNTILTNINFINGTFKVLLRDALTTKKPYSKESINVLSGVYKHLNHLVVLFLKFDLDKAAEFIEKRESIIASINSFEPKPQDLGVSYSLGALMGSIWYAAHAWIAEKIIEKN